MFPVARSHQEIGTKFIRINELGRSECIKYINKVARKQWQKME